MNNKLPKVFQNDIGDVDNNVRVYHATQVEEVFDNSNVTEVIEKIFTSPNHVYKTPVTIQTNEGITEAEIIGRTADSLITISNQKISIKDIKNIKIKGL